MSMLFSQRVSFVFEALTMSEMNDGQLCGHSCFTICTRITLSLFVKSLCSRYVSSLLDRAITKFTMNDLMPLHCVTTHRRARVATIGRGRPSRSRP